MAYSKDRVQVDTDEIQVDEYGRILNDPTHDAAPSQGNSPAAWALVALVLVGLLVAAIGSLASWWIVMWVGIVIAALGPIVGFVMRLTGRGANGDYS
ncbi:hypothetical protein GCM10023190_04440 [Enteractinococcus fodinae]|uniref:DUF3040 domain-containing protein n=1 Tax=Enteractinococcus fodinae TaxID=684663 RepID=A0ABU2B0E2_9MICC|nr:HGxxPAAW family protein [Enteractinococcus fodinae]MDR7347078.1 hypothetical protein [Enteractinococcus fodinae]